MHGEDQKEGCIFTPILRKSVRDGYEVTGNDLDVAPEILGPVPYPKVAVYVHLCG